MLWFFIYQWSDNKTVIIVHQTHVLGLFQHGQYDIFIAIQNDVAFQRFLYLLEHGPKKSSRQSYTENILSDDNRVYYVISVQAILESLDLSHVET